MASQVLFAEDELMPVGVEHLYKLINRSTIAPSYLPARKRFRAVS